MTKNKKPICITNTITIPEDKSSPIPKPYVGSEDNPKLFFSFELYEKNDFFGVNPVCDGWTIRLFDELKNFSQFSLKDIENPNLKDVLRFHPLEHVSACPCPPPLNARYEDMEQLEIGSKRNGRIHFIRADNIIYIVWFDPLHNVYPSKSFGIRKLKSVRKCLSDELEEENTKLKQELEEANELLETMTAPTNDN